MPEYGFSLTGIFSDQEMQLTKYLHSGYFTECLDLEKAAKSRKFAVQKRIYRISFIFDKRGDKTL